MARPLPPDLEALYALAMTALRPPAADTLPGVQLAPAVPEAVAVELSRRERRRGAEPAGGLFDETARKQQELFE